MNRNDMNNRKSDAKRVIESSLEEQGARGVYRAPVVRELGSLDAVQLGHKGKNYDGSSRWWYYE